LPPREVLLAPAGFARWRRDLRVRGFDRHVQVGHGDELLPVDLNAGSAPVDLARHAGGRGFEIWPPLASLVDAGGRRIEIVAAVVTDASGAAGTAVVATAAAARVPPPSLAPPPDEWLTFRLYGAQEQQDAVLFEVVAPIIAEARASDGFLRWFFLPYVDPGTGRDHLRVRLAARDGRTRSRLRRAMEIAVAQARRDGRLVAVETGDYFRETGRYGGPRALLAAEAIFEASSDAVLALLAAEHDGGLADDRLHQLVRAQDAIARGFALDLAARRALADRRRVAFAHAAGGEDDDLRGDYRQRQRALLASLRGDEAAATVRPGRKRVATKSPPPVAAGSLADALTPAFAALTAATANAVDHLPSADRVGLVGALPALLHVQAVRFCGPVSSAEQAALVLWARALESLAARVRTVPRPP
jgi:thiopeptide-type bacteriocin biosynthesis protein